MYLSCTKNAYKPLDLLLYISILTYMIAALHKTFIFCYYHFIKISAKLIL